MIQQRRGDIDHVGMTPRNVRAYQSRGLLHPPRIRGRVAYYNGVHQARLELISSLHREGFSLSAIKRMLESPTAYSAIVADRRQRRHDDPQFLPTSVAITEERLDEIFPGIAGDLTDAGLVWRDHAGQLHARAHLVAVGRTLQSFGVPSHVVAGLVAQAVAAGRCAGERFAGEVGEPRPTWPARIWPRWPCN
jgi:DNA-binding transcriptional MerR regulator